ncbi:hypothetical protein KXD97_00345 [Mycobacterium sp. SMC-8]|uniref:hypothetical protein n=1 Tax=Mycobacterium sp. SMC-8 TaxID=2857060 RepID=UPI0021B20361|nr:hypothetical protein [Mycobacterium sp. SMC-8]UXA12405.1 hypothetical protein KXD97_00345 [Mycobacterium sp. SMC-8]
MSQWKVPLEDGGVVEFDTSAPTRDIGNGRGVPDRFSYVHPGGPEQPSYRFDFGVRNKIPVCLGVHIEAKEEISVRTRDLALAHIDKVIVSAVGAVAHEAIPSRKPGHRGWRFAPGDRDFNAANLEAARAVVKGKPRTRRRPEDVDLQQVADTWRNAEPGTRTQALMTVFFCSKATAMRLKKRAMEKGFLDE